MKPENIKKKLKDIDGYSPYSFSLHPSREDKMYDLKIRIVRIKISDTLSETILTTVPRNQLPPEIVKELYKLHW